MIFLSMCFLVFYNYIVAQKGHYDFFFLHNYMDFILKWGEVTLIIKNISNNGFILEKMTLMIGFLVNI